MKEVRLGRTNLTVKKLGWGGIPIQRVGEEEGVSVISAVIEMGVDVIDTARGYTNSEYRIGKALQRTKRSVILSTKSQVKTAKIYHEVHESLKQLQVKRIPIYHVHNVATAEEYEKVMASGGAHEGLKLAQKEGLIDHLALSSHSLKVLEKVVEDGFFDVVMACYSFLEPEAEQRVFPLARERDIGVLAMKPFSGGFIEEPSAALRFVLSQPDIVSIPGSETLQKARENWKIFEEGKDLTQEDHAKIEEIRRDHDQKFCRRCDYCQPCPEKISIQHVLGVKALVKRFGPVTQELDWFQSLIEKAHHCSECGNCLPRCPYQLPIPDLIKENLAWYDGLEEMKKGREDGSQTSK